MKATERQRKAARTKPCFTLQRKAETCLPMPGTVTGVKTFNRLDGAGHLVKHVAQVGPDQSDGGDDNYGDKGGNKPVLNRCRAFFMLPEILKELADLTRHFQKLLYHTRNIGNQPV